MASTSLVFSRMDRKIFRDAPSLDSHAFPARLNTRGNVIPKTTGGTGKLRVDREKSIPQSRLHGGTLLQDNVSQGNSFVPATAAPSGPKVAMSSGFAAPRSALHEGFRGRDRGQPPA